MEKCQRCGYYNSSNPLGYFCQVCLDQMRRDWQHWIWMARTEV